MSFRANLYTLSKRSNSTKRPSGSGTAVNCDTNKPTDIMAPTFTLDLQDPMAYNYMYVPIWSRYYWIEKWVYNDGLWDAVCSIDPLASWRNQIGNATEYVLRSARYPQIRDRDEGIIDEVYPMTTEVETDRQLMPGWSTASTATGTYVIGVVGGNGLTEYYAITDIAAFGAAMFGDTLWSSITADDPGVQEGQLPSFMKAQFNPLQYVTSCVWFPFEVPHANSMIQVKFGYFNSGYNAYKITRRPFAIFSSEIVLRDHPQVDQGRGIYLNFAPYTRLKLCAGPWGDVELDTTKFCNYRAVTMEAWVDPVDGTGKLYVGADGGNDIVLTLVGQLGSREQLSQVLKDNMAGVNGAIQAGLGFGSALLGNIGGIAGGIAGIGNAIASQYPDVSTMGANGARILVAPTAIWLNYTWQFVVSEDLVNNGRPCCKRYKLNNLPGYLLIRDPDLEIPATKAEIDAIKDHMVKGFFYE